MFRSVMPWSSNEQNCRFLQYPNPGALEPTDAELSDALENTAAQCGRFAPTALCSHTTTTARSLSSRHQKIRPDLP